MTASDIAPPPPKAMAARRRRRPTGPAKARRGAATSTKKWYAVQQQPEQPLRRRQELSTPHPSTSAIRRCARRRCAPPTSWPEGTAMRPVDAKRSDRRSNPPLGGPVAPSRWPRRRDRDRAGRGRRTATTHSTSRYQGQECPGGASDAQARRRKQTPWSLLRADEGEPGPRQKLYRTTLFEFFLSCPLID